MKTIGTHRTGLFLFLCLYLLFGGGVTLHAQEYFSHSVKTLKNADVSLIGNDLWVAIPQNYESQSGKYYELYITSTKNTTVNIQITGGSTTKRPLSAYDVITYRIPLTWEITTSGVVEDKGIRVWSNDAPLFVSFLSRNPYTSDASSIIPTIGWGTEYIVAAYQSLYEGFGNFAFDYPSEFSVVANKDNTVLSITPHADIRVSGDKGKILHKKGETFTETLHRGQCVQYQTTQDSGVDDVDMTGSVVRSNNPVGVVGASQCPNIPNDFPYCDHICEMIPPIRSWGSTYYSVPFASRVGGDTYLVIASKNNQTILRNGNIYRNLNQYDSYFRHDIDEASVWTSDAPFLLAQYINSTTWTDTNGKDNNGIADPAMTMITPFEQSQKDIVFQVPTISSGTGFSNYCHIIVNAADKTTTLNGVAIASATGVTQIVLPVAQSGAYKGIQFKGYRVSKIKSGTHRVISDSGVTVMVYGYASYDSYAMNASQNFKTTNSSDTIIPKVQRNDKCYSSRTHFNDLHTNTSHLAGVLPDTLANMSFTAAPLLVPGVSDSSHYDLNIIDSSLSAFAIVRAFDLAGNTIITTTSYTPSYVLSSPSKFSLGDVAVGQRRTMRVTLTNHRKTIVSLDSVRFLKGNLGFTIDSIDNHALPPGDSMTIKVVFTATKSGSFGDTLVFSADCISGMIPFYVGIEPATILATGFDFKCIDTGTTKFDSIIVTNSSLYPIRIDSVWTNKPEFSFTGIPALPVQILAGASQSFAVSFSPKSIGNKSAIANLRESGGVIAESSLSGCGQIKVSVHASEPPTNLSPSSEEYRQASIRLQSQKLFVLSASPNPFNASSAVSLRFVYALKERMPIALQIYDELGRHVRMVVSSREHEAGIYEVSADIRDLPSGSYIYRLSSPGTHLNVSSGRIVVVK